MNFSEAVRIFKVFDLYFSRKKPPSGRFGSRTLLRFMAAGSASEARSAWTSVLFPTEILHAFDIYPMTLEVVAGMFATLGLAPSFLNAAESADVPNTMCSFHRMLMGVSRSNVLSAPSVVGAASILCDGNVKTFAEAAREQSVPFIFIDVPYDGSREGVEYVKAQLNDAIEVLSDIAKKKRSDRRLLEVVENANVAFDLLRRFYRLQEVNRKRTFAAHEIVNFSFPNHFLLGRKELIKMLERRCNDVLRHRSAPVGKKAMRLMWLHIVPQYNWPIWQVIHNGKTAQVVCDEYSSVCYERYDLSDPLGSIAKRLIGHPSNGPIERRIEHIVKVARDFKVDGIIHYSSWGCHQATGNVHMLGRELEAAGFKFIDLNGDACDIRNASVEQHRTRLEAFLENHG